MQDDAVQDAEPGDTVQGDTGRGDAVRQSGGEAAVSVSPPPVRRRRRWRRILVASLVVVVLLVVATVGAGWYFASQLLQVEHSVSYPATIKAISGSEVTLSRAPETERPVLLGLIWPGGEAVLSNSARVSGDAVVRTVTTIVRGSLQPGLHVAINNHVYDTDPMARGLNFDSVTVHGQLGDMPAWYVPPTAGHTRTTWVIAVHGLGASRTETLRILPTIAAAGLPALVITYRNDVGAPASPDGYYHLGDTEWRDVAAGIDFARAHGATAVVLYGWSMGGALSMTTLRRLPAADASFIRAVVLDSPAIAWSTVLDLQGSERHLPGFLTWTAERFVEWRADLSLSNLDQRSYAAALTVPVLMFVDHSDTTVPPEPSLQFARSRSDLITLVTTTGGDHTCSWNVDPAQYESAVTSFLNRADVS